MPIHNPDIDDRKPASKNANSKGVGSTQTDALQDHVHPRGDQISTSLTGRPDAPLMMEHADTESPEAAKGSPFVPISKY